MNQQASSFDINNNEHEFVLLPNEAVEILVKIHRDKFLLTPHELIKQNLELIQKKAGAKIISFQDGLVESKENKWLVYSYAQSSP